MKDHMAFVKEKESFAKNYYKSRRGALSRTFKKQWNYYR